MTPVVALTSGSQHPRIGSVATHAWAEDPDNVEPLFSTTARGRLINCALHFAPSVARNASVQRAAVVLVYDMKKSADGNIQCRYAAAVVLIAAALQLDTDFKTDDGEDLSRHPAADFKNVTVYID